MGVSGGISDGETLCTKGQNANEAPRAMVDNRTIIVNGNGKRSKEGQTCQRRKSNPMHDSITECVQKAKLSTLYAESVLFQL